MKHIIDFLLALDMRLFDIINQKLTHPLADFIFVLVTDLHKSPFFIIAFLLFWGSFLPKGRRKTFFLIFISLFVLALSDFSGSLIKDFFMRTRPDPLMIPVTLRAPHFNGWSMPSNHALNMFTLAQFIFAFRKSAGLFLFIFSFLVAYSRVYCGVHYPSDVIVGAAVGVIIGYLASQLIPKKWIA